MILKTAGHLMKNLVQAAVLTITTAVISVSAFAAPNEHHAQHNSQHMTSQKHAPQHQHAKAAQHWKVGQKMPSKFHGQGYKFDHKKNKKLSTPNKNQQWIKINGDYLLINTVNHSILKVISG